MTYFMPDLNNLSAQDQADFIRDDAEPALRLRNVGTGSGLHAEGLAVSSGASIDVAVITAPAAGDVPLSLQRTGAGNFSTSTMILNGSSVASGAVIELQGSAYTSVLSIDFAAGSDWGSQLGALRVKLSDGDNFGWIPLLPDSAISLAATFTS